jgi:hypothetical protein
MGIASDPRFCVLHALRIKGFAKTDVLSELSNLPVDQVEDHLKALQADELAMFREARALWQLSPKGREHHGSALAEDVKQAGFQEALRADYEKFLELNDSFKALCGDWQLRNGNPNDHSDAAYDAEVIGRLQEIDARAQPILGVMGGAVDRFAAYAPRLAATVVKVAHGEHNLFTGVMCGSYHDVWMELHEDLILSLGIDRAKEGSF